MIKHRQFVILTLVSAITAGTSVFIYRQRLAELLDFFSLPLIGKAFSQRGGMVQIAVYIALALIFLLLLLVILRFMFAQEKSAKLWIILPIIASFVLFFIICENQSIRRDDYWEIHDAIDLGIIGYVNYYFSNFNGRYFSLFLRSLYSVFPPCAYINFMLCLNLLVLFFGCLLLSQQVLARLCAEMPAKQKNFLSIVMGMCGSTAVLFMSTNIWEVWFWGSGTFVYGEGIALSILAQALILKLCFEPGSSKIWHVLCVLAIFLCCGTSELVVISMCVFSFAIVLLTRLCGEQKRWNRTGIIYWIWTWICGFTSLLSPGNYSNSQGFTGLASPSAGELLMYLLTKLWQSLAIVIQNLIAFSYSRLEFILIFLMAFFVLGTLVQTLPEKRKYISISVFVLIATAVISLLINAYIDYMPARVISIPVSWIFLALGSLCFELGSVCISKKDDRCFHPALGLCSLICFLVISWFYSENIDLVRDIRSGWEYRDAILVTEPHDEWIIETCSIPVLGSNSMDLSDDIYYEFNLVAAKYYDFPNISANEPCPPFK